MALAPLSVPKLGGVLGNALCSAVHSVGKAEPAWTPPPSQGHDPSLREPQVAK